MGVGGVGRRASRRWGAQSGSRQDPGAALPDALRPRLRPRSGCRKVRAHGVPRARDDRGRRAVAQPAPRPGAKERAILARLLLDAGPHRAGRRAARGGLGGRRRATPPRARSPCGSPTCARSWSPAAIAAPRPRCSSATARATGWRSRPTRSTRSASSAACAAAAARRPPPRWTRYDGALALWRGPPFGELADAEFARAEIRRLEDLRSQAEEARARALVELGRAARGGRRAAAPGRPRTRCARSSSRTLMLALYAAGRQVDALGRLPRARRAAARARAGARRGDARSSSGGSSSTTRRSPAPSTPPSTPARRRAGAGRARARARAAARGAGARASPGGAPACCCVGRAGRRQEHARRRVPRARRRAARWPGVGQCLGQRGPGEPYMPVLEALGALARGPAGDDGGRRARPQRAPTWLVELPWLLDDGAAAEAVRQRAQGATRARMLREMLEALDAALRRGARRARARGPALGRRLDARPARRACCAGASRRGCSCSARTGPRGPASRRSSSSSHELSRARAAASELARRRGSTRRGRRGPPRRALSRRPAAGRPRRRARAPLGRQPAVHAQPARPLARRGRARRARRARSSSRARRRRSRPACRRRCARTSRDQLDRLRPRTPQCSGAASVAGRDFAVDTLAAALERDREAVARALRRARAAHAADRAPRRRPRLPARPAPRGALRAAARRTRGRGCTPASAPTSPTPTASAPPDMAAELGFHFVAGRDPERAVRLPAARRGAGVRRATRYAEGIRHLRAALDAAARARRRARSARAPRSSCCPRSARRCVATGGWSAAEAEDALLRARERSRRLSDNEPLVSVLLALATLYELRGEFSRAHEMARGVPGAGAERERRARARVVRAAGLQPVPPGLVRARARATPSAASSCSRAARRPAPTRRSRPRSATTPASPATTGPGSRCGSSAGPTARWRAPRTRSSCARDPSRAYCLATARAQMAVVHQCRREPEAALEWAEATIAARAAARLRLPRGDGPRAARLGARRCSATREQGVREITAGLAASRGTGARMDDPHYLALLAEAHLRPATSTRGWPRSPRRWSSRARERSLFYEPELHRLDGALHAVARRRWTAPRPASGAASPARASRARRRSSCASRPTWRACSPDPGRRRRGARDGRRRRYASFDEGPATRDLREAAALLETRASGDHAGAGRARARAVPSTTR